MAVPAYPRQAGDHGCALGRTHLVRRHAALPARHMLVPIHGSPHLHQWLIDGTRLGLIDFDRFAPGEPQFDMATFSAELDTVRRMQTPVAVFEAAPVEGFESSGMRLDARRLKRYRIDKHIATMRRRARALRPDAAARAARHPGVIVAMLERA